MTVTDYSQSGEQAYMLELAAQLPKGNFLDIGAGDGETFSNTRALVLGGWCGVAVEPAAWAFDRLVALYADDIAGRVLPVCAVVTPDHSGLIDFAYSKDDHVSSADPKHAATWAGVVPYRKVVAAAVALGELLERYGPFSVVSIDAEGLSDQLVKAYLRTDWWDHVMVICYERELGSTLKLRGKFELVAATPNNSIYRRVGP